MGSTLENSRPSRSDLLRFPRFAARTFRSYSIGKSYSAEAIGEALAPALEPHITTEQHTRMTKLASASYMLLDHYCGMFGLPFHDRIKRAISLTGGMIDPYDNLLDEMDGSHAVAFGIQLLPGFDSTHTSEAISTEPASREQRFLRVFNAYKREIPETEFPGFWKAAKGMHISQLLSLLQRRDIQQQQGITLTQADAHYISSLKGGINALLYLALADPNVGNSFRDIQSDQIKSMHDIRTRFHTVRNLIDIHRHPMIYAIFAGGSYIQLVDDYEDRFADTHDGIMTPMTNRDGFPERFYRTIPQQISYLGHLLRNAGADREKTEEFSASLWIYTLKKMLRVKSR